ncbi:MAG: transglycosylase domain-containing protein [Candidatus Absconditabacterales bacterium]
MSYFNQKRLYSPNFSGRVSSYSQHGIQPNRKKKVVFWLLALFIFFVVVFGFWFTKNILVDLPDVSKINDMVFNEATLIEDRNGEVLYRLFEENREYIPYSGISLNMINAIVALEDQRYREHNGLDTLGMIRAAVSAVLNPGSRVQGASTIPQQLVRNLLLTKDRKITRKIKEILMTSKLSGVLEKMIRKEIKNLSAAELRKEMKDRTLELYLNYISFGNNAFGIEAASKAYFDKSAKDLTVLESSIIASIPKGPSLYNPYKNRDLVVGEFTVKDRSGNPVLFSGDVQKIVTDKFTQILNNADLSNKKSNNAVIKFIAGIGAFSINILGNNLDVKYINGRKDLALDRMYEDGYITEQELKNAIIEGINVVFRKNVFEIKAPHFVQWIIEELEKTYGTGTLSKGGFIVKTTLDLKTQQVAEEAIIKNNAVLQDNGANNSSMIYLDSKNGDVLAYVGSIDYFNETIKGQNDMVRRPRQTGSSIKPFIYALALEKLPLTIDTPIYDIPFKIGVDQPNNADDSFEGILPLKKALGHSRNIPAAKTFTALGGEVVAKPFLKSLGLSGISDNVEYGYPLALGAAEVTMLEFANAYTHLTTSTPAVINPILEIRSRDGSILYQKTGTNLQKSVIKPGIVSLMWKILSDTANRIPGWENKYNVAGLKYALKTGTSNAKTDRGNRARDGWLAAYTPSKVMIFRAGNADGTPMNVNAFGGTIHATPVKTIFGWLMKNNYISDENIPEVDLMSVSINKISGKAAGAGTPADLTLSTIKFKDSPGLSEDEGESSLKFDSMCNGMVSPFTAPGDVRNGYLITPTTFMPNGMDLAEITQRWKDSTAFISGGTTAIGAIHSSGKVTYTYNNIFVQAPVQMCPGRDERPDTNIKVTLNVASAIASSFSLSYTVNGPKNIRKVLVLLDKQQIGIFEYAQGNTKSITDTKQVTITGTGFKNGTYTLELVAFDFAGFSNKASSQVILTLGAASTPAPTVTDTAAPIINTAGIRVSKNADATYTVTIPLQDATAVITGKITRNGIQLYEFKNSIATAEFQIDVLGPVVVTAADPAKNILNQTIDLTTYYHQ